MTSIVPVQLYGLDEHRQKVIIWQSPQPASTSYCRPIRFRFTKESDSAVLEEFEIVPNQIAVLTPTMVEINSTHLNKQWLMEKYAILWLKVEIAYIQTN